jgi:HAD superfamily hydrolase (TIGR01509 family)
VSDGRSRPRIVIFDMDDVLCRYDLAARLKAMSEATGLAPEAIHAAIWESGFEDLSDSGCFADGEAYLDEFRRRLGARLSRSDWIAARRAAMTLDPQVVKLAEAVKSRAEVALFTNNGPLLKETLAEIHPVLGALFADAIYCSCEFAAAKPARRAYRGLTTRLRIDPADAYFIDDKKAKVDGALAAGLRAHHYTSYPPLAREVEELGLLP